MNWEYISGFFDADGYVTISKKSALQNETVYIGFTNTRLDILTFIQNFIYTQTGIIGHISTKKSKKLNHSVSFDLKYTGFKKCKILSLFIKTIHEKKKKRFALFHLIHDLTPRNGKYSIESKKERDKLVKEFLEILA